MVVISGLAHLPVPGCWYRSQPARMRVSAGVSGRQVGKFEVLCGVRPVGFDLMADAARVTNNGQVASGLLLHDSVLGPSSGLLLLRACAWPCSIFAALQKAAARERWRAAKVTERGVFAFRPAPGVSGEASSCSRRSRINAWRAAMKKLGARKPLPPVWHWGYLESEGCQFKIVRSVKKGQFRPSNCSSSSKSYGNAVAGACRGSRVQQLALCKMSTWPKRISALSGFAAPSSRTDTSKVPRKWALGQQMHARAAAWCHQHGFADPH